MKYLNILILIIPILPTHALADLTLSIMFSDNMVLQREMNVSVWGKDYPGNIVSISINNQKKTVEVDESGNWKVMLDSMNAGGPFDMTVEDGENKLVLKNILIGEVWLCSGQSNMQMATASANNGAEEVKTADNYPYIRFYHVPKMGADEPADSLTASWSVCNSSSVGNFSAAAYFFARELQNTEILKNVPIGLIDSSYGGTRVEAWISKPTLEANCEMSELRDSLFGWKPASMYNGMIAPLIPYSIRGVLWYQGESNASEPEQYRDLFPLMINEWRDKWNNDELPVYFVQLPNYAQRFVGKYFTLIREIQQKVWENIPNTAMAITIDAGHPFDVHPKNKQAVGQRLALIARALTYGEDIEYSGPVYDRMTIKDGQVQLYFKHVSSGLVNKNRGPLQEFSIAGEDGKFFFADAVIDGDTVLVKNNNVPAPKYVRYAWAANPSVGLYNREGLPAMPFRTDFFKDVDMEIVAEPVSRIFSSPFYDVKIDGDGCVAQITIKDEIFLSPYDSVFGGSYFYNGVWGPVKFAYVDQTGPNEIFADGDSASIQYEYFKDRMVWTLTNKDQNPIPFFFVFDRNIDAVMIENGEMKKTIVNEPSKKSVWFRGNARLEITGCDKLWGPWKNEYQILEATIIPNESRKIELIIGETSDEEKALIDEISKP